ncbi:MAG: tRNA (adenosine(37)-N6)-threonylcarbamoyltransferase complex dimerization subunit type 1 TsaB [Devosia sp.]
MTTLLAIDTAAPRLGLALLRGEAVDVLDEPMTTGQAERLFPAIAELLARSGTTYADLTRIAVTTGPGSFTGLRIGLSAARGLGLALGIPVIGLGSLAAISLGAEPLAPLVVLLDARRGEAYTQHFSAPGQPIDGPQLMKLEDAQLRVPSSIKPVTDPTVDMAAFARYAVALDPVLFPPEAAYIRDADAKPQEKFRVPRVSESAP